MPLIQFLIGGVQKGGTSALARYLAAHPDVRLPTGKEAHVFDSSGFDDTWTAARIDAEYEPHFPHPPTAALHGDATPIYLFHPRLVERIARYNPAMKWIILLRDPIDRAISHYYMERNRGAERLPLSAALLAESWRLRGRRDDLSADSPLRCHSYRARGEYVRQLDALYAHFPRDQILLLRSMDLLADPARCMERVYSLLGLAAPTHPPVYERIFAGRYDDRRGYRLLRWLLRQLFRRELATLRSRYGVRFDG